MEQWQDQSVILAVRPHGESGAIVSLLTAENGRQAGYMRGAFSAKNRGTLEVGNIVDAHWQARNVDSLGTLSLELVRSTAARIMHDALKLGGLQAACALCYEAVPEKEGHAGLYHGMLALLDILEGDVWAAGYIMWEIALLKELGFALDLSRCAGGGDAQDLAYVSPKTGRAVSLEKGAPYKDKLLLLPEFLKPHKDHPHLTSPSRGRDEGSWRGTSLVESGRGEQGGNVNDNNYVQDIIAGLEMTGYFLQHWVFAHHNRGLPEARGLLALRFGEFFARKDIISQA